MQTTSRQTPHCTHVFHSQTEEDIRSALTKRWIQLINRLEQQQESPALPGDCGRRQGEEG